MQRLFLGLVVEMQRLGAQLVAADFHSITINTRKRNLSAAGGCMGKEGQGVRDSGVLCPG
jgi:hypothetical protein